MNQCPGGSIPSWPSWRNDRHGFVTPADAREAGVNPINLVRMAERGQLERRGNGLYRFPLFPPGPLDPYMEAALWPRGVEGVISHESALGLYELSDVHPRRIHITVPRNYRIRREVPATYRIHHEDLRPRDIGRLEGIPIVIPEHAIRQVDTAGLGPALLAQAIDHGGRNGRLSQRQARKLQDEIGLAPGTGGGVEPRVQIAAAHADPQEPSRASGGRVRARTDSPSSAPVAGSRSSPSPAPSMRSGPDGGPRFLIKGDTSMELRLGLGARTTRDVDIVFRGEPKEMPGRARGEER